MTLRIAIQMDPLETVSIDGDTSFALAEAAQERGYSLFVYGPEHLSRYARRVWRRGGAGHGARCRCHSDAARSAI